jgi:hypothetical protein
VSTTPALEMSRGSTTGRASSSTCQNQILVGTDRRVAPLGLVGRSECSAPARTIVDRGDVLHARRPKTVSWSAHEDGSITCWDVTQVPL